MDQIPHNGSMSCPLNKDRHNADMLWLLPGRQENNHAHAGTVRSHVHSHQHQSGPKNGRGPLCEITNAVVPGGAASHNHNNSSPRNQEDNDQDERHHPGIENAFSEDRGRSNDLA